MELRYRTAHDHIIIKPLDGDHYRGTGRVYEVFFWAEDVQEVYEIELWGGLGAEDLSRSLTGGLYTDDVQFGINVLGPPVVGFNDGSGPGEPEEEREDEVEARLRRGRGGAGGSMKGVFRNKR
jgi:hypothetical protein